MSITSVRANAKQVALCSLIIQEIFGGVVESIATGLLSGGRANSGRLSQLSGQPLKRVKEALFILIQHGLVTFVEAVEGGKRIVYYEILPLKVLRCNQFPFYMTATQNLFGEEASWIIHQIVTNGRITFPDLAAQRPSSQTLQQTFIQLYQGQFIVKCLPIETITLLDRIMGEEDEAIQKKGSLLTPSEIKKLKAELANKRSLEASSAATASSAKRKRVLDYEELQEQQESKESNKDESILNSEDYYRVNDERFRVYYRNKDIVELASQRINETAGRIMGCILQEMTENDYPEGITLTKISTLVNSTSYLPVDGSAGNRLHDYLEALAQDECSFLIKTDEKGGGQYKVDMNALATSIQQRHLESIVQEKWGLIGCRIWRLLSEKGKLEEKHISKLALISPKSGREVLYKMFSSGFVFLQDVPKTADHSASRTFFLWHVSQERTVSLLIGQSYKTLINLKIRSRFEENARALLLEKTKRLDVVSGQAKLSESDQRGLEQLNKTLTRLKLAELHLERMLMMIRDMKE